MKLNKTLALTAFIIGGLFAGNVITQAQDAATNTPPAGARPPGGPRGAMNFDNIASQLGLTDEQKAKVKPILEEMRQKMADLHKDTTLEQADRRAKMKEIHDGVSAKLKEILTPDQFEKWQNMGPRMRHPQGAATPPPAGGDKSPQ